MTEGDAAPGDTAGAAATPGAAPEGSGVPLADVMAEAHRLLASVDARSVPARVLGGVAVGLHDHTPLPAVLRRTYADIDLIVGTGRDAELKTVLVGSGYEADRKFNALYGHKRQLFWDTTNGRQLDVFVGRFAMCHELLLDGRLSDPWGTLRPADLLLTKLQIVELNPKDVVDSLAILLTHRTGREAEGDVIGTDRLEAITAGDWGWYTTAMDTLERLDAAVATAGLSDEDTATVHERIAEARAALETAPKSLRWRARARIGRRMPWYELPEEHIR